MVLLMIVSLRYLSETNHEHETRIMLLIGASSKSEEDNHKEDQTRLLLSCLSLCVCLSLAVNLIQDLWILMRSSLANPGKKSKRSSSRI